MTTTLDMPTISPGLARGDLASVEQPSHGESSPGKPGAKEALDARRRIEELGRYILAYSEQTEKLQQSHDVLTRKVQQLTEELGEKNRQLERRNRLAALGEMAAGMAHEIRNPLGAIRLYASLLKSDVADRPASAQTVDKVAAAANRLESIVGQVLYFTREVRCVPATCDVAAVVRESVDLARDRVGEQDVRFEVVGPAALNATADGGLIGQAVLNLAINAADACREAGGGRVTVRLTRSRAAGRQFAIAVDDTGPGLDPAVVDRLFHPFFTTKDHGTGLGLSIVHRIVEAHDGTVEARNRPEGGARFELKI